MTGLGRTREQLVALFLLGALAIAPPLLSIFNTATRIFGVPVLFLYLFACWAVLILLVALAVARAEITDEASETGQDAAAPEGRTTPQEPRDA